MSLKIRRGTNAERLTVTPAEGELIYTTDTKELYIGDGSTPGGNVVTSESGGGGGGTGYTGSIGSLGYTGSIGTNGIVGYWGSVGYTGSVGSLGYWGSVGYTGSVPSGPAGYVGSFTGFFYTSTGTLLYTESAKRLNIDTIRGVTFTEVNIGSVNVQNSLNVFGGGKRNVTIYGTVDGSYNVPSFEMRSARGTLTSPTTLHTGDMVSAIKSTGWNGNDYVDLSGIAFYSANTTTLTESSGSISIYTFSTNGDIHTATLDEKGDLAVSNGIRTVALDAAPTDPVTGTIYTANGVDWDPASKSGTVPYPVFYDGVTYNPLY